MFVTGLALFTIHNPQLYFTAYAPLRKENSCCQFFLQHYLKQCRKCLLRTRSRENRKSHYRSRLLDLQSANEHGCTITAQHATNHFGTRHTYYRYTKEDRYCAQPYTQEKILTTQLQTLLQLVSLPQNRSIFLILNKLLLVPFV